MALGTLGIGEQINGVNLGNWLVLEKWMKPGIFAASGEADEIWLHRATESAELEALLTRHRDTYITEADFRNIAAHGCNLVRIPVPYFIFGDVSGHPGCIEYLDRAFDWAERTGLKILIDLHTVPGSQNGFDNGGHGGPAIPLAWRARHRLHVQLVPVRGHPVPSPPLERLPLSRPFIRAIAPSFRLRPRYV